VHTPKNIVTGATTAINQRLPNIAPNMPAFSGMVDNLFIKNDMFKLDIPSEKTRYNKIAKITIQNKVANKLIHLNNLSVIILSLILLLTCFSCKYSTSFHPPFSLILLT